MNRTKELSDLITLVERCLDFPRWGFKQSYVSRVDISFPYVTYDSECCRVKFTHFGGDYGNQWKEMPVHYGRLHAPNEDSFLVWNGEKCWPWHTIHEQALNFLDGLSAKEAVEKEYSPRFFEDIRELDTIKNISLAPEGIALEHAAMWDHYGIRLFELFDLRRPDLWEKYRHFLSEIENIKDEVDRQKNHKRLKMPGFPSRDKVC